jgi:hypothetical protein
MMYNNLPLPCIAFPATISHDTGPDGRPGLIKYWKDMPALGKVDLIMKIIGDSSFCSFFYIHNSTMHARMTEST